MLAVSTATSALTTNQPLLLADLQEGAQLAGRAVASRRGAQLSGCHIHCSSQVHRYLSVPTSNCSTCRLITES